MKNRGSGEMSEKRQKNAIQDGFDMTASKARRIRETRRRETFMAFVASSPDKEKIFLRKNHYDFISPHSIDIYSILCGLTPFF